MNNDLLQLNASSTVVLKFHYDNQIYYAKAFRIQYLSVYSHAASLWFKKSSKLGCFHKDLALSKYLPLAVLIDLYKLDDAVDIIMKETDDEDLIPDTPDDLQDRLLNGWKESCYIMNGSNNQILSLNKSQKDNLFVSLIEGNIEDWNWLNIVFKESIHIPLKMFYVENGTVKIILQQFQGQMELQKLSTQFRFQGALCCGIPLLLTIKLEELIPLICVDGFLYLTLLNKAPSLTVDIVKSRSPSDETENKSISLYLS